MPNGKPKHGLRVKHSDCLWVTKNAKKNRGSHESRAVPSGFYIFVNVNGKWKAITDLQFARERDAIRAAAALTAAELDCYSAMMRADPLTVKQVACEFLQW